MQHITGQLRKQQTARERGCECLAQASVGVSYFEHNNSTPTKQGPLSPQKPNTDDRHQRKHPPPPRNSPRRSRPRHGVTYSLSLCLRRLRQAAGGRRAGRFRHDHQREKREARGEANSLAVRLRPPPHLDSPARY